MSRLLVAQRALTVPGWAKDELSRKAQSVPSLDLRFADNKSLVDATTGQNLVTFTRASSGTFVGSDGQLKTATTNLLLRSEEFDNASWLRNGSPVITANATSSPAGSITADLVAPNANFAGVLQFASHTASTIYTASVYVKDGGDTNKSITLGIGGGAFGGGADRTVAYNISTGALSSIAAVFTSTSVVSVGDGWRRVSLTYTATATVSAAFTIYGTNASNSFYLWGAQLEQSPTVGEYIPTTSVINSAPRFDHNPTTGESLGLLVEEQRTNLLLQSENFGTTWSANGLLAFGSGSTLNAIGAPDGATTADLITENTATAQHNVNQTIATIGQKTFSVFAKQGPGSRLLRLIDFNATDGAQGETYFNLSTGIIASGTGTIRAFPNGWYRCSITTTTTVTSTYFISISSGNGVFFYTGDGTSGIYIWGAQLEAGAFPTSYIPTTTATVTRSADVASITGANFSSWYRQDEGTVFADVARSPAVTGRYPNVALFSDGTSSSRIQVYGLDYGDRYTHDITSAGSPQVAFSQSQLFTPNTFNKLAVAYKTNDTAFVAGASLVLADSLVTLPAVNQLSVSGADSRTIRRLTYWPTRLLNATLQAVTQ